MAPMPLSLLFIFLKSGSRWAKRQLDLDNWLAKAVTPRSVEHRTRFRAPQTRRGVSFYGERQTLSPHTCTLQIAIKSKSANYLVTSRGYKEQSQKWRQGNAPFLNTGTGAQYVPVRKATLQLSKSYYSMCPYFLAVQNGVLNTKNASGSIITGSRDLRDPSPIDIPNQAPNSISPERHGQFGRKPLVAGSSVLNKYIDFYSTTIKENSRHQK